MKLTKTLNIALVSFAIYKIAKSINKVRKDDEFKDLFTSDKNIQAADMYFDEAINGDKLEPEQG